LRQCGINIQGRSSQLKINYRTTEQIRDWASALLLGMEADDLDNERLTRQQYKSLLSGPPPEFHSFSSADEEQKFIERKLKELLNHHRPEEICLVTRKNKTLRDRYQPMLKRLDLAHTILDKHRDGKGIRLATMHRVKGLEFPVMILAEVNAGVVPIRTPGAESDPVARLEHESRERSLFFVAATRARDLLIVTSYGQPSPFLPRQ
ncbi:MAG: 3'-5' exonuclease, partial [Blastocatellia bacterium]